MDSSLNNWRYDKVDNLILYATSCGGPDDKPTPTEIMQIVTISSISPQERQQKVIPFLFPPPGFLNLDIIQNGTTLVGTFYENREVTDKDHFIIAKSLKEEK